MGAAAAGALLLAGLLPAQAHAAPATAAKPETSTVQPGTTRRADYDSRTNLTARPVASLTKNTAVPQLRDQLGVQGIVDIDHSTGTPRQVARLDGFLTGPSRQKPADIALAYVKANPGVFGLSPAALANLTLRQDYVDIDGTHHLSFIQSVGATPVFGNGLKAHVTKNGRLLAVDGSPLSALTVAAGTVKISAASARADAVKDVFGTSKAAATGTAAGVTTFSDGGTAKQVYFQAADGLRLAWQTVTMDEGYLHVIDAATGQVLYRQSIEDADSSGPTADVWTNYPGAPVGGKQHKVSLGKWLPAKAPQLSGNVAHVFSDVNDDNVAQPTEEVAPSGPNKFEFPFTDFTAQDGPACSAAYQCSWNSAVPNSWQVNRAQNAAQIYFFLGTWHDHLAAGPIGFTRAAGNFEARDGDAVQANSDDGANTANGLPDPNHVDNANMSTPPDGTPPTMQMYLWDQDSRFIAGNSGDESDVIYHEYTHGLSNRLVVDADGASTLGGVQAGAMGEAWSDWYAEDYLVDQGLNKDTKAPGEVKIGKYVTANGPFRSQPLDCPVGTTSPACPGTAAAGPGGYTYGDYGSIGGSDVHKNGEIWSETLWDLRDAVGSKKAESLVTRALELSPANPSMLDERNSILAADLVVDGGKSQKTIWKVFAKRGMGYFAASVNGDDSHPVEDFSRPPAPNTPRGTLTGKVTDQDTGAPVSGIEVAFGGHASGFGGDYQAASAADGSYTISGILPGTYADVFAQGAGYDPLVKTVSISSHTQRRDWAVRRDWAASGGGSSVVSFTGPDYSDFGCGPAGLIDQSQSTGWGSDIAPGGQQIVIELPATVTIGELAINPSGTCGDDLTAGVGHYRVETSPDGTAWTTAAQGQFADGTATSTPITLTGGAIGVRYIRFSPLTSQAQDAGLCTTGTPTASGCAFLDQTELAVYGSSSS
jgi:extracellular elastinolytic metalloproteinase